jgi:hypothetical protein
MFDKTFTANKGSIIVQVTYSIVFLLSGTRGFEAFANNKKNESQPPTKVYNELPAFAKYSNAKHFCRSELAHNVEAWRSAGHSIPSAWLTAVEFCSRSKLRYSAQ